MAIAVVARTGPPVRLSAAGSSSAGGPSVTQVSVTNPGCFNGELLIAIQSQDGTSGSSAAMLSNDGFVQRGAGGSGAVGWMKVWEKVASNEPATWTFDKVGSSVVTVLCISNWDSRTDETWDVEPTFSTGVASFTHTGPVVTTTKTLDRLIRAYASNSGGGTHSTVGTFTEHADTTAGAFNNHSVQSRQTVGAGTTLADASTSSASQPYVTVAFAIASPPNTASALYAPSLTLPHWSEWDNTLALIISANSEGQSAEDACQVSSVVDDRHNVWVKGPDVFATATVWPTTAGRLSIWYCAGAKAITRLTVTMTQIVDSLAVQLVEASGVTNVSVLDGYDSDWADNYSGPNVTAALTTTNPTDLLVAGAAIWDSNVLPFTHNADSWTPILDDVTTDSQLYQGDDTCLRGAYRIVSSSGFQSTSWAITTANTAWAILALKAGSMVTTNPNANWPAVVHELGFGMDPNDASAPITYTAITGYVEEFASQRGRDYELARTEAGECEARVNNLDGRFDPTNASSPYYPNVKVITPYRVRANWNGQIYHLFTGYVERWPQKWENMRGRSRLQTVDGLATLAGTRLAGALGAEILADEPFAYWPLNDGRLSESAANKATTTTTPLTIQTSISGGGTGSFGATLALQGEDSTCWSQARYSTTPTTDAPSAIYGKALTATLGFPTLANGILVECWARIPARNPQQNYTLFGLKASAFTAQTNRRVTLLQVDSFTGLPALYIQTSAGAVVGYTASVSGFNDNNWHHYVMHVTTSGGNSARLWIDGTERVTAVPASFYTGTAPDRMVVGGEIDEWQTSFTGNIAEGEIAHVAVFQIASPDSRRIAARTNAGLFGFPEQSGARITRLLNYVGWAGGRAIDDGLSFLGPANTIPRQTLLAAVQDVAAWENGLSFVDASGNFRFIDRANRFYQNIKYTFGDAAGEIPYETDVEIDFDPKYVFNDVTVTKSAGRLPSGETVAGGSSAHKKDQASIATYFTRSLDKTSGVSSVSQCEAEADWILENYAQPRARLSKISIMPSANPDLWVTALSIEIGDRVLVRRRPFGGRDAIELDCYVEQVGHQVKQNQWKTVLTLSPVLLTTYEAQNAWILNTSLLDIDTIVGG